MKLKNKTICAFCGNELIRKPSQIKRAKYNYCNRMCFAEHKKLIYKGENNYMYGKHQTEKTKEIIGKKAKERFKLKGHPCKGRKCPWLVERNKSEKLRKINSERQKNNNSARKQGIGNKISIKKKEFYKLHPEKHANRIMCKRGFISKPQKIMFSLFKKKYSDAELELPIKTNNSTRFADVGIPSQKIDFEYDGFKHNNSNDICRDNELKEVGWKTIRFKSLKEVYKNARQ